MTMPVCWKSELLPLAQRFAGRRAVTDEDGTVAYGALFDLAAGVAERLLAAGAEPGRPVATWLPNSRRAAAASYGVMLTGAAEAPINAHLSREEVEHCLAVAGASILVTTRERMAGLGAIGVRLIAVEEIGPAPIIDLPPRPVPPETWGRIVFTSGTTGSPKGIVHSHGGRWLANVLLRATLPIAPDRGRDVLLLTPFSHGASLVTFAFLDGGAAVTLLDGLKPDKVLEALRAGQIDQIFAPPTVLARLVSLLEGERIHGIGAIFCGTAPLPRELYRQAEAIFGPVVRITYGKSEVFNPITVLTPEETAAWYAGEDGLGTCVGWPASGVEIAIGTSDAQSDDEAPGGEAADDAGAPRSGPVLLRARHMLVGMLTEAGFAPHPPEQYHRTGDLGFIDSSGRLRLCGREADVMKSGGYRISPEEVEVKLRPSLGKGDVVVMGLPSAYWGEVVTAVAVGAEAGWVDRLAPALATISPFKRPKLFAELDDLPRNAMGKIARARVRDAVLAAYRYEDGRYPALTRADAQARAG